MLSLSQKLSLNRIRPQGGWTPGSDNVVAWYKMATGITLNGSDVSQWSDSSGNGYHMLQSDAAQQPAYSAGVLTFDPTSNECLELSGTQIQLTGDFTVGIRFNVTATTGTLLADQTETGEFDIMFNVRSNAGGRAANGTFDITFSDGTTGISTCIGTNINVSSVSNGDTNGYTVWAMRYGSVDATGFKLEAGGSAGGNIASGQFFMYGLKYA